MKSMMSICLALSAVGAFSCVLVSPAYAAPTYYVDFGDGLSPDGPPPAGINGGIASGPDGAVWTVIADNFDLGNGGAPNPISLVDSAGASSTLTMSSLAGAITAEFNAGNPFDGTPEPWAINEATEDYVRIWGGNNPQAAAIVIYFDGFDLSKSYNFGLIASVHSSTYGATYEINDIPASDENGFLLGAFDPKDNTDTILNWSGLVPIDRNGQFRLKLYVDDTEGGWLGINALRIEEVSSPGLAGDYNGNGTVDAADYTVWRDGDSPDSSIAGYNTWVANFGTGASTGVAVPEPTTTALLSLGLMSAAMTQRRRVS